MVATDNGGHVRSFSLNYADFDSIHTRSNERYDALLGSISIAETSPEFSCPYNKRQKSTIVDKRSEKGIVGECLFRQLAHFDVGRSFMVDSLHNIYIGAFVSINYFSAILSAYFRFNFKKRMIGLWLKCWISAWRLECVGTNRWTSGTFSSCSLSINNDEDSSFTQGIYKIQGQWIQNLASIWAMSSLNKHCASVSTIIYCNSSLSCTYGWVSTNWTARYWSHHSSLAYVCGKFRRFVQCSTLRASGSLGSSYRREHCTDFGPLPNFTTFQFENNLGKW